MGEGTARYTKGEKWMPEEGFGRRSTMPKTPELSPGSSFGEEILFGFQERYTYTVVSKSDCDFHIISEDDFTHHFRNLPDLRDHMLVNFMRSKGVKTEDGLGGHHASIRPWSQGSKLEGRIG